MSYLLSSFAFIFHGADEADSDVSFSFVPKGVARTGHNSRDGLEH